MPHSRNVTPPQAKSLLVAIALLTSATEASADHPDPLPDGVSIGSFSIRYTNDNPYDCTSVTPPPAPVPPGVDRNYLPSSRASTMLQALAGPWNGNPTDPAGMAAGYGALGFLQPDAGDLEITSYDCAPNGVHAGSDCDSGSAHRAFETITMPATIYCAGSPETILSVMGHEYFHHVQYRYMNISPTLLFGNVAVEGTARMMQDQIFEGLDDHVGDLGFLNEVNIYFSVQRFKSFWRQSYSSAIGWKYLAERFGSVTTEPERGSDFIRRFFENVERVTNPLNGGTVAGQPGIDLPRLVEFTIQETTPTMTIERWFHDFTLANIAREYDTSLLPSIYRYIDEIPAASQTYGNVQLDGPAANQGGTFTLVSGFPGGSSSSTIFPWTALYNKANVVDCQIGEIVGFRANTTGASLVNGSSVRFGVFPIDFTTATRVVRGGGKEFGAAFVLRNQGGNPDIDQLVAVITATNGERTVSYSFECGPGSLTIGFPSADYPDYAGPPGDPEPNLLEIFVRATGPASLTGATVKGLQASDVTVYVGTNNVAGDQAVVIGELEESGDGYFVTALPPKDKPDPGPYDLHVNLGPLISTSQPDAVLYAERDTDEVIALDVSGSMIFPGSAGGLSKIDSAKNAAKVLIDRANEPGQIGAVVFDENASALVPALAPADDGHKTLLKNAVANATITSPFAATSIGDGLAAARVSIVTHDRPGENWALLVSDGEETAPTYWFSEAPNILASKIHVAAFPVGEDADHRLLEEIATFSDGFFWPLDAESSSGSAAQAAAASTSADPLPNGLADAFLLADEQAGGQVRLWEIESQLDQSASTSHLIAIAEGGIEDASFVFHWNDPADVLSITVTRPDASVVVDGVAGARVYTDAAHAVFRIGDLDVGTWTIELTATTGDVDYLGVLAGDDSRAAHLDLHFGGTHDDAAHAAANVKYLWGLPQPMISVFKDRDGVIAGGTVTAFITHPDTTVVTLPLFDDGQHGDGMSDDGVYGGVYTRTTSTATVGQPGQSGSYRVVALGSGTNNQGKAVTRVRKGAFVVAELYDVPPDTDTDSMPDRYELLHGCLDPNVIDDGTDTDQDTLTARSEWQAGTDPCHPDTDFGGESDGSELARGANPFDPADDALPIPIDPEVIDYVYEHFPFDAGFNLKPAANLIRYPLNSTYEQVRLLRSTSPTGPFAVVATLSGANLTGLYHDEGLTNGTTYYYQVQPLDVNGSVGAPSLVFSGTPQAEPVPPIGSVLIEHGQTHTTSALVELALTADLDADAMLLSNDPGFSNAVWTPFQQTPLWTLAPDPTDGHATIFVQYRDVAGNVSPSIYTDSIVVASATSVGSVSGQLTIGGVPIGFGATIVLQNSAAGPDLAPGMTNASGRFNMLAIPPGTYTVILSYPGREDLVLSNVVVAAAINTDLGSLELGPAILAVPIAPWAWLVLATGFGAIGLFRIRRVANCR